MVQPYQPAAIGCLQRRADRPNTAHRTIAHHRAAGYRRAADDSADCTTHFNAAHRHASRARGHR